MQTKRWICGVLVGMCGVLWGGEVRGETYGCGSDPGFCYRDVGGDGCYDAGTDEASIDGALTDAGGYEATTGSIVCPPSVKKLVGAGESMSWTVPAGDVRIYGTLLDATEFSVEASGEIYLGGPIRGAGVNVVGGGDVLVSGMKARGPLRSVLVESTGGDVEVAPKSRFRGGVLIFAAGNVTLGDRFKVDQGGVTVEAYGGDVVMTRPTITSQASGQFRGQNVRVYGKGKFLGGVDNLRATTGDIDVDSMKAMGGGLVAEGTVRVGLPYKGKVRPSVISKYAYGIIGKSGVVIENMKLVPVGLSLGSESGDLSLRNSKLRKYGTLWMEPTDSGGVCDLTGTDVGEGVVVDTSACTTVVGP